MGQQLSQLSLRRVVEKLFSAHEHSAVLTSEFDFQLPEELIAQTPAPRRDLSRLLVLHREGGRLEHRRFADLLAYLRSGDVLVLNNSRVIPARLRAVNPRTGGGFEILLLEETARNEWWALMRPAKRARVGATLALKNLRGGLAGITATVLDTNAEGHRHLRFEPSEPPTDANAFDILQALDVLGEIPLPPYIAREAHSTAPDDRERYQTVYAKPQGSVAAPTAGLHFTGEMLDEIRARGVNVCYVTLHVGFGTFAPVKAERVEEHMMHFERFHVAGDVADAINRAKEQGRRVVAVGTTSVRVLESVARAHGRLIAGSGRTNIFIHPPAPFHIVDALVTNFHLPKSTLLMLVSAFASPGETRGREIILRAYDEAVRERYRFFSYGDAMLIL
jgi:S-adenosylmethionine:tRNA ribosyltransferase-isomerase